MNIDTVFPSKYLKSSDIGDQQPVVAIDRVEIEEIGRDEDSKPVIYFMGMNKGLVLNKTNAKKIIEITGSKDTEMWAGTKVRLYATETQFAGDTVDCIRIKKFVQPAAVAGGVAAVKQVFPNADEIPFAG